MRLTLMILASVGRAFERERKIMLSRVSGHAAIIAVLAGCDDGPLKPCLIHYSFDPCMLVFRTSFSRLAQGSQDNP